MQHVAQKGLQTRHLFDNNIWSYGSHNYTVSPSSYKIIINYKYVSSHLLSLYKLYHIQLASYHLCMNV